MKVWSVPAKFYNTIKYLLLFGVISHKSTFIKSWAIEGFFRKLQLPYLSLSATYHNINFYLSLFGKQFILFVEKQKWNKQFLKLIYKHYFQRMD